MGDAKTALDLSGFSRVDATGASDRLVSYLEGAAVTLGQLRALRLALLRLTPGARAIDVGCGTGDAVRELADLAGPQGRALGVDLSEAMIAEARQRHGDSSSPIEFKVADARQLGFPDNHFDGCTAERLFVHLDEPARAIAEMARITRPGARIVISEPDLDTMAIDTADRTAVRAVCRAFADQVRNGLAGRQLYRLMLDGGLDEVAVHPHPVIVNGWAAMNTLFPFEHFAGIAVAQGALSQESAAALCADLRARDAAGRFFGCYVVFVVAARKP